MTEPRTTIIAAVCGECETQTPARHAPDACFACGSIDGPWVIVRMATSMSGAVLGVGMRCELAGVWSAAARERARVELGDALVEDG